MARRKQRLEGFDGGDIILMVGKPRTQIRIAGEEPGKPIYSILEAQSCDPEVVEAQAGSFYLKNHEDKELARLDPDGELFLEGESVGFLPDVVSKLRRVLRKRWWQW